MTLKTEIIVVTDRSGSMQTIAEATIAGYNKFIREQKAEEGEARVTFTQFDDIYEVVYQGRDLREVPELTAATFQPRGGTALLDAIGRTLDEQLKRITAEKWAELVIVQIITDGQENQSRTYTADRIKGMIQTAQNLGVEFIFQAANQDAFATARDYGFLSKGVGNFVASAAGASAAYELTANYAKSLRSGNFNAKL